MREQTVAVYCLLADLLTLTRPARHRGVPVECYIHAGSEADITGLRAYGPWPWICLLAACFIWIMPARIMRWKTSSQRLRVATRKANSKRPHTPAQRFLLQHLRKGVETTFSQLTARFPKHLHAVTAAGFVLKLALFIFVHTLDQAGC